MRRLTAITISSLLLLCACDKDNHDVSEEAPMINSITPLSGSEGETVTVNGSNFSSTPSSNLVILGGKTATVTSATSIQLLFRIPQGIVPGKYKASVTVNGLTVEFSSAVRGKGERSPYN